MRFPSCIHADIHFSVWILVRLLCVDTTIPNWFILSSTRDMVFLSGAESSCGQCRICFLPDTQAALTKALYNNSSLFSSSVCLKIFYKWYSQKRKSAVHFMSSLRHIILPIVRNMVKYVLQSVKLATIQYTDGGNSDVLRSDTSMFAVPL